MALVMYQRERLATPSYKIRKEKKAGLLVSPKDVTVIGTLDVDDQSSVDSSAQLSAHVPVTSSSAASQPVSFVTAEQFEAMNNKWTEQFAHFEALLSRGNVFSTPKTVVSSLPTTASALISSQPFINPAARHTGSESAPAVHETLPKKGGVSKPIKKTQKSSRSDKVKPDLGPQATASSGPVLDIPGSGDDIQEPVFQPMHASSTATVDMGFQSTGSEQTTGPEHKTTGSTSLFTQVPKSAGPERHSTGLFDPAPCPPAAAASSVSFAGPDYGMSDTEYRDLPQQDISDAELSGDEESAVEEG